MNFHLISFSTGNTALHEAAWRGHSRCVKILCAPPHQRKCVKDVNKKLIKGVILETRSALHSALLGIRNDSGFSALHLAAQNGHNQSCREILLAGGDPDVQNNVSLYVTVFYRNHEMSSPRGNT